MEQLTSNFLQLRHVRDAKRALNEEGYLRIEGAYPRQWCEDAMGAMDAHVPDKRTDVNYGGTELRIWDAQNRHPLLQQFYAECNLFTLALTGMDLEADTLLAIRNLALDAKDLESRRGRWHIDSFRKQLKVFVFLTDTTEESGPFEFVPHTQLLGFKARMVARGLYLRPADFIRPGGHRAYQRIDDNVVTELSRSGTAPMPFLCRAGTALVVDTSSIHRARPCGAGARYALTAYCRAH